MQANSTMVILSKNPSRAAIQVADWAYPLVHCGATCGQAHLFAAREIEEQISLRLESECGGDTATQDLFRHLRCWVNAAVECMLGTACNEDIEALSRATLLFMKSGAPELSARAVPLLARTGDVDSSVALVDAVLDWHRERHLYDEAFVLMTMASLADLSRLRDSSIRWMLATITNNAHTARSHQSAVAALVATLDVDR